MANNERRDDDDDGGDLLLLLLLLIGVGEMSISSPESSTDISF